MANDLSRNPWIIDTASSTPLTNADVYISKVRWTGGSTAGHTVRLVDNEATPQVFFESFASGANFIDESDFSGEYLSARKVSGPTVNALQSGRLYIYLA